MTPLEQQKAAVKRLLEVHKLEIWDHPSPTRITNAHPPISNWTMRLGDPATNKDLFVDSGGGEYGLWCEAQRRIAAFVTNGRVDPDA